MFIIRFHTIIFYKVLILITYVASFLPMLQVARAILENPKDKTKVHLIYAKVTYEDILLKVIFVTLYGSSCLLIYCLKYLSFWDSIESTWAK